MKQIAIVLMWFLALVMLAFVCWGAALYFEWPLWLALALFVGAIGLYFAAGFARRLFMLLRSRSKLARQAVELHATPPAAMPETQLAYKWKAAVATLRQSKLRRLGNPLYVLPWYMVVGQSGTGKTTALTRARLSSPIRKVSQRASIELTANCDWWYFDRAVVIDCAGRYVDAHDIEQDRREWELGLDLLGRYRAREGVDGLVLAVSAERLGVPDADAFAEEGRVVRARIEQLIRMFGKRFPIYVLITKSDRLYGFEEWARALPDSALDQAMGYLSEDEADDEAAFVARALGSIGERLQRLRLALVARNPQATPELLMFPNELDQLHGGLAMFLRACMADNPYLERPLLRGLFFSSGLQEGGAASRLEGARLAPSPHHPGAIAGLFLHDFFGRVLPQDRHASKPSLLVDHWRRSTHKFGFAAWLLALVALGILLSVSFVGNMQTLQLMRDERPDNIALSGHLESDATALMHARDALLRIEQDGRRWLAGLLAHGAGLTELETRLRNRFVGEYRQAILPAIDEDLRADLRRAGSASNAERAGLILNLARSVALLEARAHGADRAALEALPQPVPTPLRTPELNQQLNGLSISHLAWSPPDDAYLRERLGQTRALLDRLVFADPEMTWLAGLVPDDGVLKPVRVGDFWGTSARPAGGDEVPAAYTRAGKAALAPLVDEIRASVSDSARFASSRMAFERWYRVRHIAAWWKFANAFLAAPKPFASEAEWRAVLATVGSSQSPYLSLIARLGDEFKDAGATGDAPLPGWLRLARQFQQLNEQATRLGAANQAVKLVGAINAVGATAIHDTFAGGPRLGGQALDKHLGAVEALSQYLGELSKLASDSATGSAKSYQLAADFHAAQPSLLQNAFAPLARLQKLSGSGDASDLLTWRLVRGPLDLILAYVEQQASCELQRNWQANVLWPLQAASDPAAMFDQAFGAKGSVWAFADGPAKPFLARNASRYEVVDTQGYRLPFAPAFLPMLNNALARQLAQQHTQAQAQQRSTAAKQTQQLQAQQTQLRVQQTLDQIDRALATAKQQADAARVAAIALAITAQPTGVNPAAKVRPFATVLSIQCAQGVQTLSNYNFPVGINLAWGAGQCGEAHLHIKIDKLTLVRDYPGASGMLAFLREFRGGQHAFAAADFPEDAAALDALGITQITVNYAFTGSASVLDAARAIEHYETLQKSAAQQKQQIQDTQLQRQQSNIDKQIAEIDLAPAAPDTTPTPASLGLPATIGACWRTGSSTAAANDAGI